MHLFNLVSNLLPPLILAIMSTNTRQGFPNDPDLSSKNDSCRRSGLGSGSKSVIPDKAGSMAMFYRGRTETVRPLTSEAVEAYKHLRIADKNPTEENLLAFAKAFRAAGKAHNIIIKESLGAKGFDRHLSALKIFAMRNNIEVPIKRTNFT